jgi:hypothetical protein
MFGVLGWLFGFDRSARAGQHRDHPISSSPMQTSAVLGDRSNNQHQEVIEVQILPQVKKKNFLCFLIIQILGYFQ